ncbi:MAG: hypothetical protein ACI9QD_000781 [Thermoproteota archaeon]|jgi:hypothetical protein
MFNKTLIQFTAAAFVLGLFVGAVISLNFYDQLGLSPAEYSYEYDRQFLDKVKAYHKSRGN